MKNKVMCHLPVSYCDRDIFVGSCSDDTMELGHHLNQFLTQERIVSFLSVIFSLFGPKSKETSALSCILH